jgi:hypothetical protein
MERVSERWSALARLSEGKSLEIAGWWMLLEWTLAETVRKKLTGTISLLNH